MRPEFKNEPLIDFSQPANREAMEKALAQVESELDKSYSLIIGGEKVETGEWFDSTNPATPRQVVGRFARADEVVKEWNNGFLSTPTLHIEGRIVTEPSDEELAEILGIAV